MITEHPRSGGDAAVVEAIRIANTGRKGAIPAPPFAEARAMFDAGLAAGMPAAPKVRYHEDVVGGVPGWWCEPPEANPETGLLYLHGGCYVLGSAEALRHFAGQLAVRARTNAFVADYRLAPEHPFPAAIADAVAAFRGLAGRLARIVVAGDSAGGGMTLALLATVAPDDRLRAQLKGAAVMSPWTDLALAGESMITRAAADPIFTEAVLAHFAGLYLQGTDPTDPRASPLYGPAPGRLPPIRIDVGENEVLLDDTLRYARRLEAAHLYVDAHVWAGMPHVFPFSLGRLSAASTCIDEIGAFLSDCLSTEPRNRP